MKLLLLCLAATVGATDTYDGPFLELEDGTDTMVFTKPTAASPPTQENDLELRNCDDPVNGDPVKTCYLHQQIESVHAKITQTNTDLNTADAEHDTAIQNNAWEIGNLTQRINDQRAEYLRLKDLQESAQTNLTTLVGTIQSMIQSLNSAHNSNVTALALADSRLDANHTRLVDMLQAVADSTLHAELAANDTLLAAMDLQLQYQVGNKSLLLTHANYTGETGDKGMRGISGDQGDKGYKGYKGFKGERGFKGHKGEQGQKGFKGHKGEQGGQGQQGEQGTGGDKGQKGFKGHKGYKGYKGELGEQGANGQAGDKGFKGEQGQKGYKGHKGERGFKGHKGQEGEFGSTGAQGTAGEQGYKGHKGHKGYKGYKGYKGEFGDQGAEGHKGQKGYKGEQGIKGYKGHKGTQGGVGDKGYKGLQGDQGYKGLQGEQGIKGYKGHKGYKGYKGEQGIKGYKGDQGDQGYKGHKGEAGFKGFKGHKGEQGYKGYKGHKGYKGALGDFGEQGDQGTFGDQGDKGHKGYKGYKGEAGFKGHKGTQGDQGYKGHKGQEGDKGFKGEAGVKGHKGTQGDQGYKGHKGTEGDLGYKGHKGTQGDQGGAGEQGIKGYKGHKGYKGYKGEAGFKGHKGQEGDKGFKGEAGFKGHKGQEGEFGSAGAQGDKGVKGEAGFKGHKGTQGGQGDQGTGGDKGHKGEQGDKGFKGHKGVTGYKGHEGDVYTTTTTTAPPPAPTPQNGRGMSNANPALSCTDLADNYATDVNGDYWIEQSKPVLPVPTWKYFGRFHGRANSDGSGGWGNEMAPMSAIWDCSTATQATCMTSGALASISGWQMTRSTNPAGVRFDYSAKQTFPVIIKYGLNGFHANGNFKIYADGELKEDRDFASKNNYTPDDYTLRVENFQTLKFMLSGDVTSLGPHPNFKIYEIYAESNPYREAGTEIVQKFCDFRPGRTVEFAGDSCSDLQSNHGVTESGHYWVKQQNSALPVPTYSYQGSFFGYEIYHVWDKILASSFHATTTGTSGSITFDYGTQQNFPIVVRYGVNTSPNAKVMITVDDAATPDVDRDFPSESDYPYHLVDQEFSSGFRKIKFELTGQTNAWPPPTLKIFEIYPKGNLEGKTTEETVNKMCEFGTPSVIGAAAATATL